MSRLASPRAQSSTSAAPAVVAIEQGPPPRSLMRLWFCTVWRCGVCCRNRIVRLAVAFACFAFINYLAYLAGINHCSSDAEFMMRQDEFAKRASEYRIAKQLNAAPDGDTRGRKDNNVVSSTNRRLCHNSASPRWQVDYASQAGVRCDLLVAGDRSELLKAEQFLNDSRQQLSCSAADVLLAAASCDDLRAAGYGKPVDANCPQDRENETDGKSNMSTFRLAFGIRLHRCAVQAELLLRSVYAPQHVYCLHVDGKADAHVLAAVTLLASCLPNVLLAPPDNDFVYGSVSQLHADLTCMQILLDHDEAVAGSDIDGRNSNSAAPSKWRYFLNVAGQELPLRTNAELVALLQAYNGSNDVASQFNPNIRWRYASKLYCKSANGTTVRCSRSDTMTKDPPPGNVTVYKGVSYGFFSRALVEYALRPGGFGAQLYDWIADTWAPDEQYFATLVRQPDAPGGYREYGRTTHPTARAVKWSGYRYDSCHGVLVRGVCVLGIGDLPWLANQVEAFANKFDYERDPLVVQCLTQYTNNASRPSKRNFY